MIIGLIPAWNESSTISSVVEGLKLFVDQIIVIDDGSQDETAYKAKVAGARVISINKNLGVGRALKFGFQICLKEDYEHIILVDGDGAHDVLEVPGLIKYHLAYGNDLTIGSRFLSPPSYVPTNKVLANRFAVGLLNLVEKHNISDVACGMRILSKRCLELSFESDSYDLIYEMLILSIRNNLKTGQFGISVRYDGSEPLLTPITELLCLIDVICRYCEDKTILEKLLNFRNKIVNQQLFKVVMGAYPWMLNFNASLVVYGQPVKEYRAYLLQYSHPYYERDNKPEEIDLTLV